ncbi:hypothetical protein AB0C74_12015 [Spirillospora sp. NPDC048832]
MEIAKLVLEFLKVLVWPGVLLILAWRFKEQFTALLQRMTNIDAMGINVELAEQAEAAQEAIEAAQPEAEPETPSAAENGAPRPKPAISSPAEAALGLIQAIERDVTALPVTSVTRSLRNRELFSTSLSIVAAAFGYQAFSREVATSLADRTGQHGWINLYDAHTRVMELAEREKDRPNVRETRRQLSLDGVATVKALLSQPTTHLEAEPGDRVR